jgi:3-methyl-2-oxobutanoate hydroxymethyltransferase
LETVRHLTARAVPVCAHLGLLPQSIHQLGGYRVQGRDQETAQRILSDARALQQAGAQMLVLECIPRPLAADISAALDIPVIGIGAGPECDGQVLVIYDMLGITPHKVPSFSADFVAQAGSVPAALEAYVRAVRGASFPAEEHCFT